MGKQRRGDDSRGRRDIRAQGSRATQRLQCAGGDRGPAFHREIGEYARAAGVDRLLAVGDLATHAVAAFGPGGKHYPDQISLVRELNAALGRGMTVLVKGSRFMKMERVVERLGKPRELTAGGR